MIRIGVEKPPDHSLILRAVLSRLALEEFDAALAQGDCDLDPLVPEDKVFRRRKEVTNDLQSSERLVRVYDFRAHRLPYPFASSRRRRFALCRCGTLSGLSLLRLRPNRSSSTASRWSYGTDPPRSHDLDQRKRIAPSRRRPRASFGSPAPSCDPIQTGPSPLRKASTKRSH